MKILAFSNHASSVSSLRVPTLRFVLVLMLHAGFIACALQASGGTGHVTLPVPAPAPVSLVTVMIVPPLRPAIAVPLPASSTPTQPVGPPAPAKAQPTARPMLRQPPAAVPVMPTNASSADESEPVASAAPVHAAQPPVAARFDAEYLNNPAPAYPLISRRQGESGRVLLLVQVTAQGAAGHVEIRQGSGFPRLDEAALNAVRNWRFVPARRGDEAVAASVVVPITFRLHS